MDFRFFFHELDGANYVPEEIYKLGRFNERHKKETVESGTVVSLKMFHHSRASLKSVFGLR